MGVYGYQGNEVDNVYSFNGELLDLAYDYHGNEIYTATQYPVSNNYTVSLMFDLPDIMGGTQGLAADSISNKMAQLYTGKILMIDVLTGNYTQVADSFDLLHGNAGQFKPVKESQSDDYPLLYVSGGEALTDETNYYAALLEVKITGNTSTLQRVFVVDEVVSYGGKGHFAIDFDNNVAYHVYYEKYEPASGEVIDYTYISKWSLSSYEQMTPIRLRPQNGFYKLTNLIDSFTIPYVQENQSVSFIDGTIALISDAGSNSVVFVDAEKKKAYLTLSNDMPSGEIEGIAFLLNSLTNKYDMVLCSRNNNYTTPHNYYYRYQFD